MNEEQIVIDEKKLKKLEKAIIRQENKVLKQSTSEDMVKWIKKKIEEVVSCNS